MTKIYDSVESNIPSPRPGKAVAIGAADASENMTAMTSAAERATRKTDSLAAASQSISNRSGDLRDCVERFLAGGAAA